MGSLDKHRLAATTFFLSVRSVCDCQVNHLSHNFYFSSHFSFRLVSSPFRCEHWLLFPVS